MPLTYHQHHLSREKFNFYKTPALGWLTDMALICNACRVKGANWAFSLVWPGACRRRFSDALAISAAAIKPLAADSSFLGRSNAFSPDEWEEAAILGREHLESKSNERPITDSGSCSGQVNDSRPFVSNLFSKIGTKKHIDEFLPILTSYFSSTDNVIEAERLFEMLRIRFPVEIDQKLTTSICNLFINAYLECSLKCQLTSSFTSAQMELKAREWYLRMQRLNDTCRPDVYTFCLFFNYCSKRGYLESLKIHLCDFLKLGKKLKISIDDLINSGLVEDENLILKIAGEIEEVQQSVRNKGSDCQVSVFGKIFRKIAENNLNNSNQNNQTNNSQNNDIPSNTNQNNLADISQENCNHNQNISLECSQNNRKMANNLYIEDQPSKSLGLAYIKKVLRVISSKKATTAEESYRLQELLETESLNATLAKLNAERDSFVQMSHSMDLLNIRFMFSEWIFALSKVLFTSIRNLVREPQDKQANFAIYSLLHRLSSEKIALITLLEIFKIRPEKEESGGSVKFVTIASAIGSSIEKEILATAIPDELSGKLLKYRQILLRTVPREELFMEESRNSLSQFVQATQSIYNTHLPDWSPLNRVKVGAFCLALCVSHLSFDLNGQKYPLVSHEIVRNGHKDCQGMISIHPHIFELVTKDSSIVTADPSSLPMLSSRLSPG